MGVQISSLILLFSILHLLPSIYHADKKDRDQSYFQRLGENVKRQRMDKTGQIYQKGAGIVKASYEVAFLVAKNKKAHTIAVSHRASGKDLGQARDWRGGGGEVGECFPL